MIPDQTKQKIEKWVKEKMEGIDGADSVAYHAEELITHGVRLGLELAKEAGPENKTCEEEWLDEGKNEAIKWGEASGFNEALTAKNAAIQEIIDETKV